MFRLSVFAFLLLSVRASDWDACNEVIFVGNTSTGGQFPTTGQKYSANQSCLVVLQVPLGYYADVTVTLKKNPGDIFTVTDSINFDHSDFPNGKNAFSSPVNQNFLLQASAPGSAQISWTYHAFSLDNPSRHIIKPQSDDAVFGVDSGNPNQYSSTNGGISLLGSWQNSWLGTPLAATRHFVFSGNTGNYLGSLFDLSSLQMTFSDTSLVILSLENAPAMFLVRSTIDISQFGSYVFVYNNDTTNATPQQVKLSPTMNRTMPAAMVIYFPSALRTQTQIADTIYTDSSSFSWLPGALTPPTEAIMSYNANNDTFSGQYLVRQLNTFIAYNNDVQFNISTIPKNIMYSCGKNYVFLTSNYGIPNDYQYNEMVFPLDKDCYFSLIVTAFRRNPVQFIVNSNQNYTVVNGEILKGYGSNIYVSYIANKQKDTGARVILSLGYTTGPTTPVAPKSSGELTLLITLLLCIIGSILII